VHTGGGQAEVSLLVYDDVLCSYDRLAIDETTLYRILTLWDAIVHDPCSGSYYEQLPGSASSGTAFHVRASLGPGIRGRRDQRRFLRHGGTTPELTEEYEMRCEGAPKCDEVEMMVIRWQPGDDVRLDAKIRGA
jgi:hypothetical protein